MTHPIVEAGARAIYEDSEGGWDNISGEIKELIVDLAIDHSRLTILAALRAMREETRIRGALHLGNSTTAHTLGLLIQGYIDALIQEIEG